MNIATGAVPEVLTELIGRLILISDGSMLCSTGVDNRNSQDPVGERQQENQVTI